MELRMMKTFSKTIAKLTIVTILFCLFSLPCFAELRRVPASSIVEQGLIAITVDAEGAEDFRYAGLKDKRHTYVGKIKPESKVKFVRLQVTAKKGDTVIKTENFRKENVSNLFLNYTVPKDADTLEVIEVFTLTNKSKDSKYNQKVTTVNKLILSAREDVLAAFAGQPVTNNSPDKKTTPDTDDKKTTVDANNTKDGSGKNTEKTDGKKGKSTEESPEAEAAKRFTRIVSGIAFLVFLAGIGFHFFVKNRKSNKIASDRLARKEQLRLQAIERRKYSGQTVPLRTRCLRIIPRTIFPRQGNQTQQRQQPVLHRQAGQTLRQQPVLHRQANRTQRQQTVLHRRPIVRTVARR